MDHSVDCMFHVSWVMVRVNLYTCMSGHVLVRSWLVCRILAICHSRVCREVALLYNADIAVLVLGLRLGFRVG